MGDHIALLALARRAISAEITRWILSKFLDYADYYSIDTIYGEQGTTAPCS